MQNLFLRSPLPLCYFSFRMGPSYTRIDQIPHFKILYIRFIGFRFISSRIFMSAHILNPLTNQVHQKYQSIAILTLLQIQQLHSKEWKQNCKSKVCRFFTCQGLENLKRKRDRQTVSQSRVLMSARKNGCSKMKFNFKLPNNILEKVHL